MKLLRKQRPAYLPADKAQTVVPGQTVSAAWRRSSMRRVLTRALVVGLMMVFIGGLWLGWHMYSNVAKVTGNKNPLQLLDIFTPSELQQTNGRVNILLAGYSNDDPGHAGSDLTDSIMILSLDPAQKKAVVISVPRDLYVNIPGNGYAKINAAYVYGEQQGFSEEGYFPGGMGLLQKTITENFGVAFGYYSLINYTAVKDAVDAVGGVTVTIASVDSRGLYDPNTAIKLANGAVTLDGRQALDLARSRGDGYGSYGFPQADFNRAQHQQMLLLALKNKAGQTSVIANPFKAGELADVVSDNVKTNLQLSELRTLYYYTKQVNDTNIKTVSLNNYNGTNLLRSYQTFSGQSALIPAAGIDNFASIRAAVTKLLAPVDGATEYQ